MKLGSACQECRKGKRKCNKSMPGTMCEQCRRRGIHCSSLNRAKGGPATLISRVPIAPDHDSLMPSENIRMDLVDLYICYIHDKPHSLFHEPSLRSAIRDLTASLAITFAIFGLSARFSTDPKIRSRGSDWCAEAKRLCKQDVDNICVENIQACILTGNICLAESNPDTESIFFVIANRMAQLLNLADDSGHGDAITQEVKRRVWWSLYLIDRWASAGLGLPRQFHAGEIVPRLPMDELTFSKLGAGSDENWSNWEPGIWSHMISLVKIFGHIQDLNRGLVDSQWDETYIETQVLKISTQLDDYEHGLPRMMAFSPENLRIQISRGQGRKFVALHLGFHHYATLLYYQYLDLRRPANSNTRMFAQRCKYHAIQYHSLVRIASEHEHAEALHNIVGHMTIVSSSVLLHTLLLGDDDELDQARERLEFNFKFLVRLREIWSSVDLMMKRLITFQNACLRTAHLGTHRFDKWMVRFLLQHALALDEIEDPGTSPSANLESIVRDERLAERSKVTETIIFAP